MVIKKSAGNVKALMALFILAIAMPIFLLTPNKARAVTVGPAKMEFTANPGETIEGTMFVQNEGQNVSTKTFYPVFEKFIEENGSKQFFEEESDLSTWFRIDESVTLAQDEGRRIPFQIIVPNDAPPGGHFAVIWWSTAPAKSAGLPSQQVSVVTRAGILVYLTVTGDIQESGDLTVFKKDKKIYNTLPAYFTLSFHNSGNVHLTPTGQITIKGLFGRTADVLEVNKNKQQVLPKSNRSYDMAWESGKILGIYRANLNLKYGANGVISETVWIFLLPWKWILLILIALFMIFFLLPKGINKYNQWIISKAQAK